MKKKIMGGMICVLMLVLLPAYASAQASLSVNVDAVYSCDSADFTITVEGGTGSYTIAVDFGDESFDEQTLEGNELVLDHPYLFPGEYPWSISVEDSLGANGSVLGLAAISGPEVTLMSTPFPPLLTLEAGEASASFSADVSCMTSPYTFEWDLNGDGLLEESFTGSDAEFTYTEGGYFDVQVRVTDSLELVETDSLTVQVLDPESKPSDYCHPTAQKIAEAVNSIFPDQADQIYSCEDIFNIFEGALTGYQLGFGHMWHAYQLSQTIEELTWEQILDWQLNTGGWGLLVQLDRYGDLLEEHSIVELIALVASEEYSMNDVRGAVRAVTHYEADFEDALERISEGTSPGELGQFYKLAQDLEVDPTVLDEYLEQGHSLTDLRHSAKFAERMDVEWTEIADAFDSTGSWGEVNQAYRMADDEYTAEQILTMGVQEFRAMEREEDRTEREEQRTDDTAQRITEQYGAGPGEVMELYNVDCDGSWSCVRKALREKEQSQTQGSTNDRESRTAQQIASKYGVSESQVMSVFNGVCSGDWSCTRAHFRDQSHPDRGKPDK